MLAARSGSSFATDPLLRTWSPARGATMLLPFALAGLSEVIYATAFPPLSWTIAAWVSLVPLLVACAALSPLRAAMAGMCVTMAGAVGVASFLPAMLSRYFGLAVVPTWIATVAIVAGLHGIFVGGYAAWVAWLVRRRAAHPILLAGPTAGRRLRRSSRQSACWPRCARDASSPAGGRSAGGAVAHARRRALAARPNAR